jgi:hypothetical protein
MRDLAGEFRTEPEPCGGETAKFQEASAGNAMLAHDFVEGF